MTHIHRRFTGIAAFLAALTLAAGLIAGIGLRASAHEEGDSHPAHIHLGTCDAPGEIVFPLSNVSSEFQSDGTPMAGSVAGAESAIAVDASVTTVPASLADIVAGGHTIVAHESDENIQNYIACGDIGGAMMGASDLPVGLGPVNDSGYSGIALLHDNGDGTTTVSLYLTESEEYGDEHDTATPATGGAAEGEVAASIKDFAFDPATIEIAAGTTVTWTNNDTVAHTVSQSGGGFESGKLDPGMTFSFTFDTPGTYEYFCQFHPNMKATIVVS
jgi:plastocyanin